MGCEWGVHPTYTPKSGINHGKSQRASIVGQFVNVKYSIASSGLMIDIKTGGSTQVFDQILSGEARNFGSANCLQRLPELLNVLIGDLRLIGVKSLSPDEASKITEKWQQKRNEYDPGFTRLWYIQNHLNSALDEILIMDAYYVATRTWREDIRIFW